MPGRLEGKVALVTGASSSIGEATALEEAVRSGILREIVTCTFYTNKCSPKWVLWCKTFTGDKSGSLGGTVSPRDLRSERQEQFMQASLS